MPVEKRKQNTKCPELTQEKAFMRKDKEQMMQVEYTSKMAEFS